VKPAVFLDRDNTLIISDGYLGDPAGVVLIAGAAEAIARLRKLGFAVVTFSNQSGVARGMFGEEAVIAVNQRMDRLLREQNGSAIIDRHEFCPYHPQAAVEKYRQDSDLRKPKPGMIHRAAAALDLDLSRSWVIGDAARDIEAGAAAGCRTILINDPTLAPSPAALAGSAVRPDATVSSLAQAVEVIQRQSR
jgi:D-glycero-D-manno-heptose 1,7-bisphosphate phosphatase